MTKEEKNGVVCLACLSIPLGLGFGVAIQAAIAWVLVFILDGFGVTVGFWPAFGVVFLLSVFTGGFRFILKSK